MNRPAHENAARYQVREFSSGDETRWDTFVDHCPDATFYHLSGWRGIIENELRHQTHYLFCERDGDILGVLPLARIKSLLFGDALISVPFLVYGGPAAVDQAAVNALIEAAKSLALELGVDYLELRNQAPILADCPVKDSYVTFSKELDPDPEKNLLAIPRKQRAMIRKGIQAGLSPECDDDARRLYSALLECKRNLGTPFFSERYLQSIRDTFGERAEILTVTRGNDVICSVMSFRHRNQILPYYGGGGDQARRFKGNDYMYWAVMEKACRDGVEVFDYGRSMVDSGSYRFKKHWGFEPRPLYYEFFMVNKASPPNLSPTNSKFELLISAWKRLPLPVASKLGPPVARCLG